MLYNGLRVGETGFYQHDGLTDRIARITKGGKPLIYLKDEADNASGGHKARVVASVLERWDSQRDPVVLTRVTEGGFTETFGYFLKHAKGNGNISFASIVDYSMPWSERRRLGRYGHVVRADLSLGKLSASQQAELVRESVRQKNVIVVPIDSIDVDGFGSESIGTELYDHGVREDWAAYLPVGGGNTAAGVVHGTVRRGAVPRFRFVTIPGNLYSDVLENGDGSKTHLHARYSGAEREVRRMMEQYDIPVITVLDEEIDEAEKFLKSERVRVSPTSSVPWAAIERHAREGKFMDGEKVVYINTGAEQPPVSSRHWMKYAAAAAALGLLAFEAAPRVNNEVQKIRAAHEQAASEEDFNMQLARGQQEYLVVSTTDPIEAFAWYNAKIEPLEGSGSLLEPKAREFALIPDHGKAGLVRRYFGIESGKIKAYDSWEFRINGDAHKEFQEFLETRAQMMKTSRYVGVDK